MPEQPILKTAGEVMPAATARLFGEIRETPLLGHFTLIGGTALSLHIGHRVSEDLDFITLLPHLPRAALNALESQLEKTGHRITHQIHPATYEDFLISGLELENSQQNWIVDESVKLTFFSAEPPHARLLSQPQSQETHGTGFRIATFHELCQLKAIVTASRSKSRDWLDLFILERDHQFGMAQWKEAFDLAGLTPMHFEIALARMCGGMPDLSDEGYSSLLPIPPTIEEIQTKFRDLRHQYESTLARAHMIKKA